MDWTGSRMRVTGKTGMLTLTPEIAGPYERGDQGVLEFVTTYALRAIERMRLERILVESPEGRCLGEVLPPPVKRGF